jgi:hypothetical protein
VHAIEQGWPATPEGTALAHPADMPSATTSPSKTNAPNDAPPTTVATREEPAGASPKPHEAEPRETADNPYDNLACTD